MPFFRDMCSLDQKDKFTCSSTQVFATASVVVGANTHFVWVVTSEIVSQWGAVGPALQFSSGKIY